MAKQKEKKPLDVKKLVFNIVLWVLGGVAILLILLWDYIFVDKPITADAQGGFAAIGTWFQENYDIPIYTVVVIAIVLVFIALLNLFGKYVKVKNRKAATFSSLMGCNHRCNLPHHVQVGR